jgi:alpha-glucosidase
VLKAIPAVYDESVSLPGTEPGKVAAVARRSGKNWFVGILNGANATTLDLSLGFLGSGTWQSVRLGDVSGKADAWDRKEGAVSPSDTIKVTLSTRGGFVAWFKQ